MDLNSVGFDQLKRTFLVLPQGLILPSFSQILWLEGTTMLMSVSTVSFRLFLNFIYLESYDLYTLMSGFCTERDCEIQLCCIM